LTFSTIFLHKREPLIPAQLVALFASSVFILRLPFLWHDSQP